MSNDKNIRLDLLFTIPIEVIINNIIPFTYSTKPKPHLDDIKSYYVDKNVLENIFYLEYNAYVLSYDLIWYFNKKKIPIYFIEDYYCSILRRHFMLSNKPKNELFKYVFYTLHRTIYNNPERVINFLWGLLNPYERTEFINNYIDV